MPNFFETVNNDDTPNAEQAARLEDALAQRQPVLQDQQNELQNIILARWRDRRWTTWF